MRIKWLMITLGYIVDMARLGLEFMEDSLKTRSLQRVGRLFYVSMLEGSKSVRTCIATRSITKRNRVGQLQVNTNSTHFSVLSWKWSVELCPERGICLMIIQQLLYKTTLLWMLLLTGLVMRVLESLIQMRGIGSQRISNCSTRKRRRRMQLWNIPRLQYSLIPLLQWKTIREISSVCMFLSNQRHPVILHLSMISMNAPTLLNYARKIE